MKTALGFTTLAATALAVTVCGTPAPVTATACVVDRPPHLSAAVTPSRDEVRRLLAAGGQRYAGALANPVTRQRFQTQLDRMSAALDSGQASDSCRAFHALSEEFHRAAASVTPPERNAFALVLDLTAAALSRQANP